MSLGLTCCRATAPAQPAHGQGLDLPPELAELLQAWLLPRLRHLDVQSLENTCRAMHAAVRGVTDAPLCQLARVHPWPPYALPPCTGMSQSQSHMQGYFLPVGADSNVRQQLRSWAGQAATVTAGSLQRSCEVTGTDRRKACVSPLGDLAAVLDMFGANFALLPLHGRQVDVQAAARWTPLPPPPGQP